MIAKICYNRNGFKTLSVQKIRIARALPLHFYLPNIFYPGEHTGRAGYMGVDLRELSRHLSRMGILKSTLPLWNLFLGFTQSHCFQCVLMEHYT